ncbi:extracellular catalytic domain type 1 short-chain-length polyhydroxyalkanoate depolymerase [Granulosicoccus sp. 3-233]|uniref:extracellular catalytic domain type 1 short-chain-length polyhydroxyalkanoate depolymerase n=1 Tax=Granulosicoccus sp. 3-233 TaxID=3417969 RepID=UPI003D34AA0B
MINVTKRLLRLPGNAASSSGARDLVTRTLAQHGLMAPPAESSHGSSTPPSDSSQGLLKGSASDTQREPLSDSLRGSLSGSLRGSMPGSLSDSMPESMRGLVGNLPEFGLPSANASRRHVQIPEGAEFRQDIHACAAGSRAYRTYISSTADQGLTGLIVMLHGCTQNPEDFAIGTDMNAWAEKGRFVVVYPQQSRGDNAQSCWNWFSRADQQRDRGEPAILAGMTRKVMAEHGVLPQHTFVAGLSAGAAMAVILGETYPDVFAAVGAHSGLPFGAARDVPSAFAAMAGNGTDTAGNVPGARRPRVPTIVFHGAADTTVHPSNGDRIARQAVCGESQQSVMRELRGSVSGRAYTRQLSSGVDGSCELEYWMVDGLGHAWSGGQPGGSYTDGKGPDASAEMVRFFFERNAAE